MLLIIYFLLFEINYEDIRIALYKQLIKSEGGIMNFTSLFIIAVALAMDASGVSISLGIRDALKMKQKIYFVLSFAIFQFLFSFAGAYSGMLFSKHLASVPSIIGGITIAVVGVLMIKEGMEGKSDYMLTKWSMYIILGISVSIDALVVGFTAFQNLRNFTTILWDTIFIGIITFILSALSFFAAGKVKKISFIPKYADYIGGVMLVLLGLKMIF